MPCGLLLNRIRARLSGKKQFRQEKQEERVKEESNPKHSKRKPVQATSKPNEGGASIGGPHKNDPFTLIVRRLGASGITTQPSEGSVTAPNKNRAVVPSTEKVPEEPVDPEKAYLSRLPSELKLEIIEHICMQPRPRYAKDPTAACFNIFPLIKIALMNLRLANREFSNLVAPKLFRVLRFTNTFEQGDDSRKEFMKDVLPLIAPHVRMFNLSLSAGYPDQDLADVVSLLRNVTWLSLAIDSDDEELKTLGALESLSNLENLTLHIRSTYSGEKGGVSQRMIMAHSKRLTALYLHFEWGFTRAPGMFTTIRDELSNLTTLHVVAARGSNIDRLLLENKPWAAESSLKQMHWQELTELEASLVPKIAERFRNLTHLVISSCGPFGTYGDAQGKEEAAENVMRNLPTLRRSRPLEGLRIVHFTDWEARLMSPTPTTELIVNDPLDQMLFGPLLKRSTAFPGLQRLTLEYIDDNKGEARKLLEEACRERGIELVMSHGTRDVTW